MAGMRYLLDTNILSEPVAARPNPFVMEKLKTHGASLALAAVSWQEMLYGMYLLPAGKRRAQIKDYLFHRILSALPIIAFDESAAQ
jgi:tRNA(fMet)-specific endonuclease VapC